jgi:hypothetical protein
MVQLVLTPQEAALLGEILTSYLSDLRMEIAGIHLRRDTMIPQWFQGSKAAAASDGHAVHF